MASIATLALAGCSFAYDYGALDAGTDAGANGGSAGSTGSAGSAGGPAGGGGQGGRAGTAAGGRSGAAGSAGFSGAAGGAGSAGNAGVGGAGGSAGSAGSVGVAGSAGTAGGAGFGGNAGSSSGAGGFAGAGASAAGASGAGAGGGAGMGGGTGGAGSGGDAGASGASGQAGAGGGPLATWEIFTTTSNAPPDALVAYSGEVFWTEITPRAIRRKGVGGESTDFAVLSAGEGAPRGLVLAGGALAWHSDKNLFGAVIQATPISNVLREGSVQITGLAADGSDVYWGENDSAFRCAKFDVAQACSNPDSYPNLGVTVAELAVRAQQLFVLGSNGTIVRASKTDGSSRDAFHTATATTDGVRGFVASSQHLHWVSIGGVYRKRLDEADATKSEQVSSLPFALLQVTPNTTYLLGEDGQLVRYATSAATAILEPISAPLAAAPFVALTTEGGYAYVAAENKNIYRVKLPP